MCGVDNDKTFCLNSMYVDMLKLKNTVLDLTYSSCIESAIPNCIKIRFNFVNVEDDNESLVVELCKSDGDDGVMLRVSVITCEFTSKFVKNYY